MKEITPFPVILEETKKCIRYLKRVRSDTGNLLSGKRIIEIIDRIYRDTGEKEEYRSKKDKQIENLWRDAYEALTGALSEHKKVLENMKIDGHSWATIDTIISTLQWYVEAIERLN